MNALIIANQIYSNINYDNAFVITNDNKFIIREKVKNHYNKMQLMTNNLSEWYVKIQNTLPFMLKSYRKNISIIIENLKIITTEYGNMLDAINVLITKIQYLSNDIEDIAYKKIMLISCNKSINDNNNNIKKLIKQIKYYNKNASQSFSEVIN